MTPTARDTLGSITQLFLLLRIIANTVFHNKALNHLIHNKLSRNNLQFHRVLLDTWMEMVNNARALSSSKSFLTLQITVVVSQCSQVNTITTAVRIALTPQMSVKLRIHSIWITKINMKLKIVEQLANKSKMLTVCRWALTSHLNSKYTLEPLLNEERYKQEW